MFINACQIQWASHEATQAEQMVVRQKEQVSPCAHLLLKDSLATHQGVVLIQVDIGGRPLIPLAQHTISILAVFRVPNFSGRFEALNDVF
jgi:hypothetical protein